jgi:hypothetical protein
MNSWRGIDKGSASASASSTKTVLGSLTRRCLLQLVTLIVLVYLPQPAWSFVPLGGDQIRMSMRLFDAANDVESQINQGLQRARQVLKKSKAKLAAREEAGKFIDDGGKDQPSVPFFAQTRKTAVSREGVVKSVDEKTGLITADGERMAAISEQEDWEFRSLFEVFENEMSENEDVYSVASQQLAERDVAASVWNLRKQLQMGDYQRIFDTKNRFIGEDN